ncbi:MAG: PAS domain S-box protein [Elusimicrobia bacterium]|nr:PAS domain S-box protein [Elusimicrobiota bacterium]
MKTRSSWAAGELVPFAVAAAAYGALEGAGALGSSPRLALAGALATAAATGALLLRALRAERLAAEKALADARLDFERRLLRRDNDLGNAKATLRVAALSRSEDRGRIRLYRELVDSLPLGVAVLRPEGPPGDERFRIVDINPAGLRLIGAEGKSPADLAPTVEPLLRDLLLESLRTGQERSLTDYPTTRVPGARFSLRIFPLGPATVGVAFEDITAAKAAQDALRRNEEQLRLMVDVVQDYAIFRMDADGLIVSWNRGAQKITGYRVDEILGRRYSVLFEPDDAHAGLPEELLRRAARDGRSTAEGWRVRKDGSRFWTDSVLTPLTAADGRLRGFVKVIHDATERRRARQELEQKSAELARSNSELTQFALVASHDLQAPLRKAVAFAAQLEASLGGRLDAAEKELLTRMNRGLEGMQELIVSLLELARAGADPVDAADIDATALAREVVDELDAALRQPGGGVGIEPLPRLRGDPRLMRQLLQNLIANAVKFRKPGEKPWVRVTGRALADDRAELRVEDHGVGFDMKDAARLFQPFSRLHGRRDFPGNGMGLAICRRIVERHGGTIAVERAPGSGAAFTVTLPSALERGGGRVGADPGGASWNNA